MTKLFTIIKVGYSAGVYGCTGEYFNCIIVNDDNMQSILFSGMYGAEERVARELKELGYSEKYIRSKFGKLTGEDKRGFVSEYQALEQVKLLK